MHTLRHNNQQSLKSRGAGIQREGKSNSNMNCNDQLGISQLQQGDYINIGQKSEHLNHAEISPISKHRKVKSFANQYIESQRVITNQMLPHVLKMASGSFSFKSPDIKQKYQNIQDQEIQQQLSQNKGQIDYSNQSNFKLDCQNENIEQLNQSFDKTYFLPHISKVKNPDQSKIHSNQLFNRNVPRQYVNKSQNNSSKRLLESSGNNERINQLKQPQAKRQLPNGTVKIHRKKVSASQLTDISDIRTQDQGSFSNHQNLKQQFGKHLQTPVATKDRKQSLLMLKQEEISMLSPKSEDKTTKNLKLDRLASQNYSQLGDYINFTNGIQIQEFKKAPQYSQLKIRQNYLETIERKVVGQKQTNELNKSQQIENEQDKVKLQHEMMIETEKYIISKKVLQKIIRIKLPAKDRRRLKLIKYDHQSVKSLPEACMLIHFEGIFGYIENQHYLQQSTLFVRPGYTSFLEQTTKNFLVSFIFPRNYQKVLILEIVDQLAKLNINLFQIYRCKQKPKYFQEIFNYDSVVNDFRRVSQRQFDQIVVLVPIQRLIDRETTKKDQQSSIIKSIKGLSFQDSCDPVSIIHFAIQDIRLDKDDSNQSVSLSYLNQSLQYFTDQDKNQIIPLEKGQNFKIKLKPLDSTRKSLEFAKLNLSAFQRMKQYPIHGLKVVEATIENTTFGQYLKYYSHKDQDYQNLVFEFKQNEKKVDELQQVKYFESQRANDQQTLLKQINSFQKEMTKNFFSEWTKRHDYLIQIYNNHLQQSQNFNQDTKDQSPRQSILQQNLSPNYSLHQNQLIRINQHHLGGSKRSCECCKNKKILNELVYDECQVACEFIKENYDINEPIKIIIFPSYMYPPITNTVHSILKNKNNIINRIQFNE
eukprot:403344589